MKRQPTDRQRVHLDRGGDVFIPPDRMARIRWEECVLRSQLARTGYPDVCLRHGTCHCGSLECVGMPSPDVPAYWSLPSPAGGGELAVALRGVIVEASVQVEHNPEGKFALRVTDPRGRTHRAVSAREPSAPPWMRRWRSVDLPAVVGAAVEGVWRLTIVDHALGEGEHLRPWRLRVTLTR